MTNPTTIEGANVIRVGLADMVVSNDPQTELVAQSLGSCLAVIIYDPVKHVGGLLHVMLPDSTIHKTKADESPYMFVDTGVPLLFRSAYKLDAEKHRIIIKTVGGADLLSFGNTFTGIGQRNYEALTDILKRNGVRLRAQDVGGNISRTVRFEIATGRVLIRTPGKPEAEL
jgi:chemotaxis protein CheD